MKILSLLLVAFILNTASAIAQNDTIWYNREWTPVVKDSASYYRPSPKQKDTGFWIVDYYKSGKKQMEGFSLKNDEDIFQGPITWYYENGKVYQIADYKNGIMMGELKSYLNGNPNSEAIAFYDNGKLKSGNLITYFEDYSYYKKETYANYKVIKEIGFEKNPKEGLHYEMMMIDTINMIGKSTFYDAKGKTMATLNFKKNKEDDYGYLYEGSYVSYYFNPMTIRALTEMDGDTIISQKKYYPSGKLRENFIKEDNRMLTKYFDEKGKNIGTVTFKPDSENSYYNSYGLPWNGKQITFNEKYDHSAQNITSIENYKDGETTGSQNFYANGTLQHEVKYNFEGNKTQESEYDANGKLLYVVTYKDGSPYNGTVLDPYYHNITTYKDGKITKQIQNYSNGKVFKIESNNIAAFYDLAGKKIGSLTSKEDQYGYKSPIEGDDFVQYNDTIESISSYTDGYLTKRIDYKQDSDPHSISKEEVWYEKNQETKRKIYYSNGQLQSETWLRDYNSEKADFYNMKGELLSKMTYYPSKRGTDYNFFYNSDEVETITEYGEDEAIIYEKKFAQNYDAKSDFQKYFLLYEIDYNGKASYFGQDGKIIATATFKNGTPFDGKTVDYNQSYLTIYTTSEYKNGAKNGAEITYSKSYNPEKKYIITQKSNYKDGRLNGASYQYSEDGTLQKLEHYNNNLLDGESITYSKDGSPENTITYKEGKPIDGVLKEVDDYSVYNKQQIRKYYYSGGTLNKKEIFLDGQLSSLIIFNKTGYVATKYSLTGSKEFVASLNTENEISGKIDFYNNDGDLVDTGIFKNGLPVGGVFHIDLSESDDDYSAYYDNSGKIKHMIFKITESQYIVKAFDEKNVELLNITEKKMENGPIIIQYLIDPASLLSQYTKVNTDGIMNVTSY